MKVTTQRTNSNTDELHEACISLHTMCRGLLLFHAQTEGVVGAKAVSFSLKNQFVPRHVCTQPPIPKTNHKNIQGAQLPVIIQSMTLFHAKTREILSIVTSH